MHQLLNAGVSTRRGVMTSHRETAYKNSPSYISLPASEDACDNSIIIPLYIPMSQEEITSVIHAFRACFNM